MWWRALLAAVALSCTFTRILAQAPQRLDHIKDLLCVLVLNGVQKEDLDISTLQKLQRHNVNINDLNNEELRNICQTFESNKINHLNTTKESVDAQNTGIGLQNQTQNRDDGFNGKENKNEDKPQKLFLIEPIKNDNVISHKDYNGDAQKINCNEMMKYNHGQSNLNMMNFWKNCITVNKPINYDELPIIRQSFMNNTKANAFEDDKKNWQHFSFNKFSMLNNFTQKHSFIPSAKLNNNNMGNMLEHQSFNNPNLSKGQANSKVPEELLQQKSYPALGDYNTERFDLSQNLRQAGIKHRFKIRGDNFYNANKLNKDTFRREPFNVDETTRIPRQLENHNYLYRDNEVKTDPFRKESVKVNELSKFNYNTPKPDNGLLLHGYKVRNDVFRKEPMKEGTSKFIHNVAVPDSQRLYRYNEPNKHNLQSDFRIADELSQNVPYSNNVNLPYRQNIPKTYLRRREPGRIIESPKITSKISNDNLFYVSKLNKDSLGMETVRADESPKGMPYISNSHFVHRKNKATQSKSIRTDNIPKFIYDTPNSDHFYRENPLNENLFNMELAKKNNFPNFNRNIFSDKLLYAKKDPNEDKPERLSVKVNESPKLILNIPVLDDNLFYSENERKKDLFRRGSTKADETPKSIPNVPAIPDEQLNYNENTPNKNKFQSEVGMRDDSSKVISNIPNANALSNKNIPDEGLRASETVKEDEQPKIISDNLDFVYDTPDRDSYRENEPNDDAPGRESIEFDETSKMIPNITKDTFINIHKSNKNSLENKSIRKVESTKNIPSDIITNIAESVKAILLRDLKKELTTVSTSSSALTTTLSTTTYTVPTTEQTTVLTTVNDVQVQEAVLNKFMKLFEQMSILKNNPFNVNNDNVQPNNQTTSETNFETSTTEFVDNVSKIIAENTKNKNKLKKRIDYNFEPQLHKNRANEESKKKKGKVKKVQEKDKSKPVTIQTNSMEIRPLGVYVDKLLDPINQNIVLTTVRSGINEQKDVKISNTEIDIKKNLLKPKVPNYYTYDDSKAVSNINQNLRISENSKYNNYRDIEMDKYYNTDHNERGAPKFYERLENINSKLYASEPKITLDRAECCNRKYISQLMHECCNEKVVSRHQVSLANLKGRPYDDTHFNSLVKSQQKVNNMLEKILAARNKFRSVENI